MSKVGTRVIYDKVDGRIISILHRVDGGLPRKEIKEIAYIDLGYDDFNLLTHDITGVDEDGNVLLKTLSTYEAEEQQRIHELEDALLLATDAEIGGIL